MTRERLRTAVIGLLLVGLAAGAFLWWGQPRLAEGPMTELGAGTAWAEQEDGSREMLVSGRPAGAAGAVFSIRNDGRLPVTVLGLDDSEATDWLARQRVRFVPGVEGSAGPPRAGTETVTLGPGEEATVLWSLGLECQPAMGPDMSMGIDALRFRVRWLGVLPARREVALAIPVSFAAGDTPQPVPGPECDRD